MGYKLDSLYTEHKPYFEVKRIKRWHYLYKRWVTTNGGSMRRCSRYVGKCNADGSRRGVRGASSLRESEKKKEKRKTHARTPRAVVRATHTCKTGA